MHAVPIGVSSEVHSPAESIKHCSGLWPLLGRSVVQMSYIRDECASLLILSYIPGLDLFS